MRSHGGALPSPHPATAAASSPGAACLRRPAPLPPSGGAPVPAQALWARPAAGSGLGRGRGARRQELRFAPLRCPSWEAGPRVCLGTGGPCPRVLSVERRQQLAGILLLDPSGGSAAGRAGPLSRPGPSSAPPLAAGLTAGSGSGPSPGVSGSRPARLVLLPLTTVVRSGNEEMGSWESGRHMGTSFWLGWASRRACSICVCWGKGT